MYIDLIRVFQHVMELHVKCRQTIYAGLRDVLRQHVPDTMVPWSMPFPDYTPPDFTSPKACNQPWSDPWPLTDSSASPDQCYWNRQSSGGPDRRSHLGPYHLTPYTDAITGESAERPLNPRGRTGLCGRGVLGRWGPNHAADTVLTRWRLLSDPTGSPVPSTPDDEHRDPTGTSPGGTRRQLEVLVIRRGDCGQWALPGGMIDPGESPQEAAVRELCEEALVGTGVDEARLLLQQLQSSSAPAAGDDHGSSRWPHQLFTGYVDDPRNTDNSWMETVAFHWHLSCQSAVSSPPSGDRISVGGTDELPLCSGSDAVDVCWKPVSRQLKMYASHGNLLKLTVDLLGAQW